MSSSAHRSTRNRVPPAIAAACLFLFAPAAARADWWTNANATGFWDDGANWNTGLPPAIIGEVIFDGTAIITNTPPNVPLDEIWCGNNGLGSNRIEMRDGTLGVNYWFEIGRLWGSTDPAATTNMFNLTGGSITGGFNSEIGWQNASGGTSMATFNLSSNASLVSGGFFHLGCQFEGGAGGKGIVHLTDNAQLIWGQNGAGALIGYQPGSTGIVYQGGNAYARHRFNGGNGWWVNLGDLAGSYGEWNIDGGLMEMYTGDLYTYTGDGFNVGSSGTGVFNVSNGLVRLRDLVVSKWNGSTGTVNQFGGSLDVGVLVGANGDARIGGFGGSSNTLGRYNMAGGSFLCAPNLMIGADGTGSWYQVGGVATSVNWTVAGRFGAFSHGTITVEGGVFDKGVNNGTHLNIGEDGTGILTVTNTGLVRMRENLYIGMNAGSSGTVNLDGGTLESPGVGQGPRNGTAVFNFNGGTLLANAGNGTFMEGLTAAYVLAGGAVIDTDVHGISIRQNLLDGGGNGGLIKNGEGALELGGVNTFTGKVRIEQGMVRAISADALGAEPAVFTADQITLNGSTLCNWDSQVYLSTNRGIALTTGDGFLQAGWSGNPVNGVIVGGPISGPGGLGINQDGAPVMLSSAQNSYEGDTTIGAEGPGWWNFEGAFTVLVLGNSEVIPHGPGKGNLNIIPDHSGGMGQPAFLDMNGFDETVNGLTGSGYITNRNGASLSVLTVGANDASGTFNGSIGGGGGDIALVKTGAGMLTLNGASTHGGGTTVQGGTLAVVGSLSGSVLVTSNGTLSGTGQVGEVSVFGTLNTLSGGPLQALTTSNLTLQGGCVYNVRLGTGSDLTTVNGDVALAGTLNIADAGGFGPGAYTLILYSGTLSGPGLTIGATPNPALAYQVVTTTPGLVQLVVTTGVTTPDMKSPAIAGTDVVVNWTSDAGQTNVVQTSTNLMTGFTDLSGPIAIVGSGTVNTNYTHAGAATNASPRFYRVRLDP